MELMAMQMKDTGRKTHQGLLMMEPSGSLKRTASLKMNKMSFTERLVSLLKIHGSFQKREDPTSSDSKANH